MFPELQEQLSALISEYGVWVVAIIIGLESMGLPLPGEAMLIATSIYAGTTHRLGIGSVLGAGMAGAIVGDNIGYWIGREAGFRLLSQYGQRVGISKARLRLGQYLFLRHGGKVVFFGRFVAVLRATAALLAGALRMEWRRFLVVNIAASVVWVGSYGFAAYLLGYQVQHLLGPIGVSLFLLAVILAIYGSIVLRRHAARFQASADALFPEAAE